MIIYGMYHHGDDLTVDFDSILNSKGQYRAELDWIILLYWPKEGEEIEIHIGYNCKSCVYKIQHKRDKSYTTFDSCSKQRKINIIIKEDLKKGELDQK